MTNCPVTVGIVKSVQFYSFLEMFNYVSILCSQRCFVVIQSSNLGFSIAVVTSEKVTCLCDLHMFVLLCVCVCMCVCACTY